MPMVGGLDVHRKQITFDYLDTATGEVQRGQIAPADRAHLAAWLARRFPGGQDADFALEGCTGWRYVAGELVAAGLGAHVGEPAENAAARGPKKRAKTDRAGSRHMRQLLADGRLPECWIPPSHPGVPGAPRAVSRSPDRPHRLGPAHPRGVVSPGRPAAGRGKPAHRGGTGCAAGHRRDAAVAGRAAAGRHGPGLARRAGGPPRCRTAPAAGRRPAPDRGESPPAAPVRGGAGHRAGADLLARRRGPVLLRAQGGPVHRAGCQRVLLGRQALTRAPVPAGTGGAALVRLEADKTHARASAPDYRYYAGVKDRIDGPSQARGDQGDGQSGPKMI